jgi:hypothetical protein
MVSVPPPQTILNFVVFACGLFSVFFTIQAKNRFTEGLLKKYVTWVGISIYAIFLSAVWRAIREAYALDRVVGEFIVYPEYILVSIAFVYFAMATNKAIIMADVYGFREAGERIKEVMEERSPDKQQVGGEKE